MEKDGKKLLIVNLLMLAASAVAGLIFGLALLGLGWFLYVDLGFAEFALGLVAVPGFFVGVTGISLLANFARSLNQEVKVLQKEIYNLQNENRELRDMPLPLVEESVASERPMRIRKVAGQ